MIEIKGYPGYFLGDDNKTIIGLKKKPLKPVNNCVVLCRDGERIVVPVNKLIFCAQNEVSPDEIQKGISFRDMGNGVIEAETFGERMSYVKKQGLLKVKISDEQIVFLQKYLILVKEVHDNVEGAKSRLYSHILNDRIEYINYAYKIGGNLTAEKAEMFADDAILATMEAICNFERMITNPRGCVKSFIKGYVRESRKKKTKPLITTKKI